MKHIYLVKVEQLTPFIKVLEQFGAPIRKYCQLAGFPIEAVTSGTGVIGEYSAWQFIETAAKYERYNLFGYNVAQQYPIHSVEGLGGMRMRNASSLKVLLEYFIEDAQAESSGCFYSLRPDTDGMWFVRKPMFQDKRKSWQVEQYMIAIIIQIIRLCAGPKWLPPELRISSSKKAKKMPDEWSNIDITWGSETTEIWIPEQVLLRPPTNKSMLKNAGTVKTGTGKTGADKSSKVRKKTTLKFADLVLTQVQTNNIGLKSAAIQTGVSTKTLKRMLAAINTSYSKILDKVRLKQAKSKLKRTGKPIYVIAHELGYEHQANFTRAFKRLTGMTPAAYRKQLQL